MYLTSQNHQSACLIFFLCITFYITLYKYLPPNIYLLSNYGFCITSKRTYEIQNRNQCSSIFLVLLDSKSVIQMQKNLLQCQNNPQTPCLPTGRLITSDLKKPKRGMIYVCCNGVHQGKGRKLSSWNGCTKRFVAT